MIMITATYLKVSNYSHCNSFEHVCSIDCALRNILICVIYFKTLLYLIFFISSFLAHLSRRRMMSCYDHFPSVVRTSMFVVRPHLWTTSPLKLLSQFSSNFMWSLLLQGDWKVIQMVTVCLLRWPPYPYVVKRLKIFSRTKKALRQNLGR